jgi:oligopeptide transport system ATP-binding protein
VEGVPLLSVEGLRSYFFTKEGIAKAVDGVSFRVAEGEALGLVGESGCGKSVTCRSIVRLLPQPACRIVDGRILLEGEDLVRKTDRQMRAYRGKKIGMILQDPLTSLNPVYSIGGQVAESFRLDAPRLPKKVIRQRVVELLRRVRIPSAEERLDQYPFQFSGGMRQRVLAAISMARQPSLIIADEPTTSLDVTIQDQFLRLLKEMQEQGRVSLILVTHDLGLVAETCDRVAIMYAGRIVENGTVESVFRAPAHPYTRSLLRALPDLTTKKTRLFQIEGEPPNLLALPEGCHFSPRCPDAMPVCRLDYPAEYEIDRERTAACWLWAERGPRTG